MTQQAITAYANAIRYEYPDTLMYLHYAQMFPYLRNDSTLYFSSDEHPGMGGLDIFKAVKQPGNNQWRIENMGFPVNSLADDFGITMGIGFLLIGIFQLIATLSIPTPIWMVVDLFLYFDADDHCRNHTIYQSFCRRRDHSDFHRHIFADLWRRGTLYGLEIKQKTDNLRR